MIVDLDEFVRTGQPVWTEFERLLDALAKEPARRFDLALVRHFHHLHQRVAADLARIQTFAAEPSTRAYLESLVARAYAEVHETREPQRFRPLAWLTRTLPRTFRRRLRPFLLSVGITLAGCLFGAFAMSLDPSARALLLPGEHAMISPEERVQREESQGREGPTFTIEAPMASFYMTHNTRVSVLAMALGLTYGIGTIALLFSNGVMLGAIVVDYVAAGQGVFVAGWLLPHGSVEIPAIVVAGQAGLLLAGALIGDGRRRSLAERLRAVSRDLVTLIVAVALMLTWAGFIEAFLSQHHQPVMRYSIKIALGLANLSLLVTYFTLAGRGAEPDRATEPNRRADDAGRAVDTQRRAEP